LGSNYFPTTIFPCSQVSGDDDDEEEEIGVGGKVNESDDDDDDDGDDAAGKMKKLDLQEVTFAFIDLFSHQYLHM
jgi:flavodoxin